MASFMYGKAALAIHNGGLVPASDTYKLMFVTSAYTPNKDTHQYLTASGATAAEIVATNYTGGHGGAGRKAVTKAISIDATNHDVKWVFSDLTWASLGGATNATIEAAILFKQGTTDDTDAVLVAYFDLPTTTTNGLSLTLTMDTTGNVKVSY